ncbi:hypothetical protein [Nonomuraea roseola]|uniref:Uncharacterized protein n=1 Tax=Nonomuraea roseola TaxID=46179 RepID=A0ABV5PVR3_9ACTN
MPLMIAASVLLATTLTGLPASAPVPGTATGAGTSAVRAAATAPNLRACHDGRCRLTLRKSVSFRVSSRFGITRLAISFTGHSVRVKGTGPGVTSQALLGEGTTGSVNGIGVRVLSLSSGKAVLRLTPVR